MSFNPIDAIEGKLSELKADVTHAVIIAICRLAAKGLLGYLAANDTDAQRYTDALKAID